jgi:hypothetical protein
LLGDLAEHGPRHMHVASAHPGRSPGLPTHDRVDHDIRDPEDQKDRRRGVASVMKAAVPRARVPEQLLPDVEVGVRTERPANR